MLLFIIHITYITKLYHSNSPVYYIQIGSCKEIYKQKYKNHYYARVKSSQTLSYWKFLSMYMNAGQRKRWTKKIIPRRDANVNIMYVWSN